MPSRLHFCDVLEKAAVRLPSGSEVGRCGCRGRGGRVFSVRGRHTLTVAVVGESAHAESPQNHSCAPGLAGVRARPALGSCRLYEEKRVRTGACSVLTASSACHRSGAS